MLDLVEKALFVPKKRLATKPSKGQIQKRIDNKKKLSEKKENRKFRFSTYAYPKAGDLKNI